MMTETRSWRGHIVCILLLFIGVNTPAQSPLFSHYKRFAVEDGLPQNFVSGLVQDKAGFLWIGTRDGLARYDGRTFRTFRVNPAEVNLGSNVISSMYLDHQNRLWIRSEEGQVRCFDVQSFKNQPVAKFPAMDSLFKREDGFLAVDHDNVFYSRGNNNGFYITDLNKGTIRHMTKATGDLASDLVVSVAEDRSGRIWIMHPLGFEVTDVNRTKFRFIPFPPEIRFQQTRLNGNQLNNFPLKCLPDGRVIAGDVDQLIEYDEKTGRFQTMDLGVMQTGVGGEIRNILQDAAENLYIFKYNTLFRWEKNGRLTTLWRYENHKSPNAICPLIDHSNVFWLGTNAYGLYKVDLAALPFFSAPYQNIFHTDVLANLAGSTGKVPLSVQRLNSAYQFRYVYRKDSSLLISNFTELKLEGQPVYLYEKGNFSPLPFPAEMNKPVCAIGVNERDEIVGLNIDNFIYRWTNPRGSPSVKRLEGIKGDYCIDLETEPGDGYWISSGSSGLYHFRNDSLIQRFSSGDPRHMLPADQLTDIQTDPDDPGLLWIGTLGKGLLLFNKQKGMVRQFTMADGLPNNTIYNILPDRSGNLWMSTNFGICRLSRNDLHFRTFDLNDGLRELEFNRYHAFLFPDGRIAFGGSVTYVVFDPSMYQTDTFSVPVQLTGVSINNTAVEFGDSTQLLPKPLIDLDELVLPYNRNFLSFDFAGLEFNQPEKIRYRYRLIGYDKDWVYSGSRSQAYYTKLPPGQYTLLLNASNASGQWSMDIRKLVVIIKPPFWATWWAYMVYGAITLLLISLYWRYRNNRLRMKHAIELEQNKALQLMELDKIKSRFFSNITHELRTPLTLILTPLEKLKSEPRFSAPDQRILANAHRNAGHLLRLINQLLDTSKLESGHMKPDLKMGDLAEFTGECIRLFSQDLSDSGIQLTYSAGPVSGHHLFDIEKWEKILFNLLGNAFKFTSPGGKVNVSLDSSPTESHDVEKIRLIVSDTGIGIAENDLPFIFDRFYMADDSATKRKAGTGIGLSLVRELTELMHGTISVSSKPGSGTTFRVELPLTKVQPGIVETVQQTGLPQPADQAFGEPASHSPVLLIVEDNDELRNYLVESLTPNWTILSAMNGKVGLDMALDEMPDLVISDVMMPEMDGYELCSRIKSDSRTSHIPFVLLTARAAMDSRLEGLQQGADVYLTKPFSLDELQLQLNNLLVNQERIRKYLQKEVLPEAPLRKMPNIRDQFVQQLYDLLEDKIDDPQMSVEYIANRVNMSQRTLNRKLKSIIGLSPVEFIRQFRLQKAAVLLAAGHGIAETAFAVGFDSHSYFSKCFREQFGIPPSDFAEKKSA